MKFIDKVVWVVGASSGIGEATAYEFARRGAKVIISSRRLEELNKVRQNCLMWTNDCYIYPLDITDDNSVIETVNAILKKFERIDIVFNNSGVSQRSLVDETPLDVDRKIMDINYFGSIAITKALLPSMIQNGGGHFVVNTSITGKFGFPLRSAYCASKHALHGFYDSLRAELFSKNIKVTLVVPGRINTKISINALDKDGNPYGKMDEGQAKGYPVEKCAKKILQAVKRNKKEVLIGNSEILLVYIKRYIPWLYYIMVRKVSPT